MYNISQRGHYGVISKRNNFLLRSETGSRVVFLFLMVVLPVLVVINIGLLVGVVIQQFLNEVHVCQEHTTTAISAQAQFVQSFHFIFIIPEQSQVGFPFVTDDFTACKATDRNDHMGGLVVGEGKLWVVGLKGWMATR